MKVSLQRRQILGGHAEIVGTQIKRPPFHAKDLEEYHLWPVGDGHDIPILEAAFVFFFGGGGLSMSKVAKSC